MEYYTIRIEKAGGFSVELKKNDRINLKIESCSSNGSGVGRHNGMAVFVPATAGLRMAYEIVKELLEK